MGFFAASPWIYIGCGLSWLLGLVLTFWYTLAIPPRRTKAHLAILMTLESTAALATVIDQNISKIPIAALALTAFLFLNVVTLLWMPGIIENRDWKAAGWYGTHLGFVGGTSTKLAVFSGYLPYGMHVLADLLLLVGGIAAICWRREVRSGRR